MGGKNSHIHILVETKFHDKIKSNAKEKGLTISEYCRQKLKGNSQLDRIEKMLNKLLLGKKR